jgi:hypothetical protein
MRVTNVVKEKNLVFIYPENKEKCYTIDINTGELKGLSGSLIKRVNIARSDMQNYYRNLKKENYTYFEEMLCMMFDNYYSSTTSTSIQEYIKALATADSLTNAKVPFIPWALCLDRMLIIADNLKEFIAVAKRIDSGEQVNWSDWYGELEYRKFLKVHNISETELPYEHWSQIEVYPNIIRFYKHYLYAINHRHSLDALANMMKDIHKLYSIAPITTLLNEYYGYCITIGKEPEKSNNIARDILETYALYYAKKQEYDINRLRNNYAQHKVAFNFTYGDYTIVVPNHPDDIINEGRDMHHCVGSYAQSVVENRTYIVFVRHKDTPNKCYITAEVDTHGKLRQYYLAHDRCISSDTDREFRAQFVKHLKDHWHLG